MDKSLNLSEIYAKFSNENAARALLEQMRWGSNLEHAACPHCGTMDPYRLTPKPGSETRKGLWKCRGCRKQFTVTVGTVFESSHISLSKWIMALYLMAASKKGMSAHQLYRMLGLKSYKSAWFMAHRLRYAMTDGPHAGLLRGTVEVDETYTSGVGVA